MKRYQSMTLPVDANHCEVVDIGGHPYLVAVDRVHDERSRPQTRIRLEPFKLLEAEADAKLS